MAQFKVARNNGVLGVTSLGPCVAVALYDALAKVGALAHIMLPDSAAASRNEQNWAKFADSGVKLLIFQMLQSGAARHRLKAKIAGGARLPGEHISDIGRRNVQAVRRILIAEKVPLIGSETGGSSPMTVEFNVDTGKMTVYSVILRTEKEL